MPRYILSQFLSVGGRHSVLTLVYFADHKDGNLNFFTEELFEADLSIKEWAKHWIAVFSNLVRMTGKCLSTFCCRNIGDLQLEDLSPALCIISFMDDLA
jgi:hypothetical protein